MSKKAPDPPKAENHERWVISYADMLTLLFALFVVLYATSDANPRKLQMVRNSIQTAFDVGILTGSKGTAPVVIGGEAVTPSIERLRANNLEAIKKTLGTFAKENGISSAVQIRSDADSITISLSDNLLFDSGSADLKPGSQAVLSKVAESLKDLTNQIRIEGHTDTVPVNSPDFATNWELSAARASTVLRFLAETGNVTKGKLFLAGYADTQPVGDNATPEGRALNRRADIVIVYPNANDLQKSLSPSGSK